MTSHLFLPYVGTGPTVPAQSEPLPDPTHELFVMLRDHEGQRRKGMLWHATLANAAQRKVERQAREGWWGHTDPQGVGANEWVRRMGYNLPPAYAGGEANFCESLCHGGDGTPQSTLTAWLSREGHRTHVLGLIRFYEEQIFVGLGYVFLPGSAKTHYWAFIAAHPEG